MKIFSQLVSAQLENRTSDYSSGTRARIWMRTDTSPVVVKFDDGSAIRTLVTTDNTQTLTNKTLTSPAVTGLTGTISTGTDIDLGTASNTSRLTIAKDTLANITALTRKEGTVWYASDTDKLYKDDGTSLTEIGSGSGGSINYISNPDAESATTGWATYADAAGTSPVDGTGGSPTATITRTTSSPLRGTGSFLITKDAANRQGEGVSFAFTCDTADQAKVLNVSFDYQIASGTFTSGDSSDLRVWIYDVTNSVLIPVSPYTIQGGGTAPTNPFKFTGTFQTSSNSTSYRLIIHIATTNASAWTFKFDNVVVGPQIQLYGAPIGDWTAWTPTGSWSSNVNYAGRYRRVGDSLEVNAKVNVTGTPTSTSLQINMPSGFVIDTTKLAGTTGSEQSILGIASILDSGTATYSGRVSYYSTTAVAVQFMDDSAAGVSLGAVSQATSSPASFANGDSIDVVFTVPIVGFSSTVLMSNDTDTRVVAARASGDPASAATTTVIIIPTVAYDTHSAYNNVTGRFTAPVSGFYRVHGYLDSGASTGVPIEIYVDGASVIRVGQTSASANTPFSGTVKVTAGQLIDIRPVGGTFDGNSNCVINFERLSGPSAIAATESVNARLSGDPASATTTNPIIFPTADYDTHGAYNVSTGLYTVPVSGKYQVSGFISSAGSGEVLHVYVDSSSSSTVAQTDSNSACSFSATFRVLAGQTLSLRPVGSTVNAGSSSKLYIERIGNY